MERGLFRQRENLPAHSVCAADEAEARPAFGCTHVVPQSSSPAHGPAGQALEDHNSRRMRASLRVVVPLRTSSTVVSLTVVRATR